MRNSADKALDITLTIDTRINKIVAIVDLLALNNCNAEIAEEFDTTNIKRLILPIHSKLPLKAREYMEDKRKEKFKKMERYVSRTFCDLWDPSLAEYQYIVQTLSRTLPSVNETNTQSDKTSPLNESLRRLKPFF